MSKKLLSLILLLSLIFQSLSTRNLIEESSEQEKEKENESPEKNGEEESCEKTKEESTDFSKIPDYQIRKENLPHSQVLMPIRRIGTSNMELGQGPCGGVEKKPANTLTNKGSSINVVWEILVPENKGNCTVKLSSGKQEEESFKLLQPTEGKINQDGSFVCGRDKGFEHKEFILPSDYECDGCTLQWKWSTSYGDIYSCSDIIINGGSLSKCMGKCLNGGSCFNGKCLCAKGFTGEFCESIEGQHSLTWLWILICLALLAVVGFLIYKYREDLKVYIDRGKSWLTSSGRKNLVDFEEGKNNNNNNPFGPEVVDSSKQS
jgi:hypothetical protein